MGNLHTIITCLRCESCRSSLVNWFQQVQPKLSNKIPSSFHQGKHCNLYSPASGSTLVCSYRPIDTTRFNDNWNANGSIKRSCRSSQSKKDLANSLPERYTPHSEHRNLQLTCIRTLFTVSQFSLIYISSSLAYHCILSKCEELIHWNTAWVHCSRSSFNKKRW